MLYNDLVVFSCSSSLLILFFRFVSRLIECRCVPRSANATPILAGAGWGIVLMFFHAITGAYIANIGMAMAPTLVEDKYKEECGNIMVATLGWGSICDRGRIKLK